MTDRLFIGADGRQYLRLHAGAAMPMATVNDGIVVPDSNGRPVDIGCVGNGIADDFAAITSRIDIARNLRDIAGSAIVDLPIGSYRISDELSLANCNNIHIRGAGRGKTIIKPEKRKAAFKGANDSGNILTNFTLSNLEIDGSNQTLDSGAYTSVIKGVFAQYLKNCTFIDLSIHDCAATGLGIDYLDGCVIERVWAYNNGRLNSGSDPGGAGIGIGSRPTTTARPNVIHACFCTGNKRYGIFAETQGGTTGESGTIISDCYAALNGVGFGDAGYRGAIWHHCIATDNSVAGFSVDQGTLNNPTSLDTLFDGCVSFNNGVTAGTAAHGFLITNSVNTANIVGHRIEGCRIYGNTGDGIRIYPISNTGQVRRLSIKDNYIHANARSGIFASYNGATSPVVFDRIFIIGNKIYDNNQGPSTSRDGIRLDVAMSDSDILDNEIWDDQGSASQDTALYQMAARIWTRVRVRGNKVRGHVNSAQFLFSGTLSDCRIEDNEGYNPLGVSAITVGPSPYTYIAGPTREVIYIDGGTVTGVLKGSNTIATSTGVTIDLGPNDAIIVAYSVAPTMNKDRR